MPETLRTPPRPTSAATRRATPAGGLVQAAWLGERLLLVVAWVAKAPATSAAPSSDLLVLGPAGPAGEPDPPTRLLTVVRGGEPAAPPPLRLTVSARAIVCDAEAVAAATVDVRTLVRESLAGLDAGVRDGIVSWLARAVAPEASEPGGYSLCRRLHAVRESLREPRRAGVVAAEEPRGLQVDTLLGVDATTYWLKGWARDADAPVAELTLVSPEGDRGELWERALRLPRPDVERFYAASASAEGEPRSGFVGLARLTTPSRLGGGWIVELRNALDEEIEVQAPAVVRDPLAVRAAILGDFGLTRRADEQARAELFEPALTRVQARLAASVAIDDVREHGRSPRDPEVSIVVPLYRRIDFLEHQLVQFARDPQMSEADIVYVLDSPEDAEALERLAPEMHALTGVPFRVATLSANAGFSGANNLGASLARGRKLLLLNSDVLPAAPGWIGAMSAFFDATPQIGALAPKLLYEDDSLQHAGMYFLRAPGSATWENMHYFKGLGRHTPAANVARRVPTVTGACLMVERERYERLGGLRGQFVQGDYEDSDLCLRLREAGLQSWYLPDAELYHLEAQSYPSELRRTTTAYNTWLQTHLWGERIAAAMDEIPEVIA
jgi:GT2 family glycosyltransferase